MIDFLVPALQRFSCQGSHRRSQAAASHESRANNRLSYLLAGHLRQSEAACAE